MDVGSRVYRLERRRPLIRVLRKLRELSGPLEA